MPSEEQRSPLAVVCSFGPPPGGAGCPGPPSDGWPRGAWAAEVSAGAGPLSGWVAAAPPYDADSARAASAAPHAPTGACDCPACMIALLSQVIVAVSLPRPSRCVAVVDDPFRGESVGRPNRVADGLHLGAAAGVEVAAPAAGLGLERGQRRNQNMERGSAQSGEDSVPGAARYHEQVEHRTTVVLRRVGGIGLHGVCRMLDLLGLACTYDVVRMGDRRARGSALVNFVCAERAAACVRLCSGRVAGGSRSHKAVTAEYAASQGASFVAESMKAHFERQLDPICHRGDA